MYDISLILRRNAQKKNGEYPVYIRLKIDFIVKIYATKIAVVEENWDDTRFIVKKSDTLYFTKNETIHQRFSKAEKIMLKLNIDGIVSFDNFESQFIETKKNDNDTPFKTCYYQYARDFIELNKSKWVSEHTRHYYAELTKLEKFQEAVFVEDMNVSFLARYEKYMRETLKNKSNTVHKSFKFMKPILSFATKEKIIQETPFGSYSVAKEPTNRDYLTIDELHKLENLLPVYKENKKLSNVLTYFLFACYTGLRYYDLAELRHGNIINQEYIELIMHKTRERVIIPLSGKAKLMLPEASNFPDLKVFKVVSNQKTNDYLKNIAIAAGINKTVTCHVARHTFATVCLTLDIPLPVVSKLLGHTDIKTTQIYAKIVDKKKFDEMSKWNSL